MNTNKTSLYFTLVFIMLFTFGFSQNNLIKTDTSKLEITTFKDGLKNRYSGSNFDYSVNDTDGVNLIQRVLRKFFNWMHNIFGFDIDFIDYKTLEYIIYGLLAIIILYLLIKVIIENPVSSVFKTNTQKIDGFSYVEEAIDTVDFDILIKKALKSQNYRLATRYLYLKSLKTLTSKGIIEWHFDKTNLDYLKEIKDNDLKTLFKRVSYIYDYIWYGEFPVDANTFNKNQTYFNQLIKTIQHG